MSTFDFCVVGYLVMLFITAAIVYNHLGGEWKYRLFIGVILGLIWPLPIGMLIIISLDGLFYDIINWFRDGQK